MSELEEATADLITLTDGVLLFPTMDQRGHLNRMLRLALPFFVDATFCAQTLAQMRRHPELAVRVGDSCLHEPHRRSCRDRSGLP